MATPPPNTYPNNDFPGLSCGKTFAEGKKIPAKNWKASLSDVKIKRNMTEIIFSLGLRDQFGVSRTRDGIVAKPSTMTVKDKKKRSPRKINLESRSLKVTKKKVKVKRKLKYNSEGEGPLNTRLRVLIRIGTMQNSFMYR